jgi:hypothetical protein
VTPLKAEYIGADHLLFFVFRLQLCGGPYIPVSPFERSLSFDKIVSACNFNRIQRCVPQANCDSNRA